MAHDSDERKSRRSRPRLASDLLEPGMVIAQPGGLEEALARELAFVETSYSGANPLDANLFESPADEGHSPDHEPATIRLDLEGPTKNDLATQQISYPELASVEISSPDFSVPDLSSPEIPMPAPRRLGPREPTVVRPTGPIAPVGGFSSRIGRGLQLPSPAKPLSPPAPLPAPPPAAEPRPIAAVLPLGARPTAPIAAPVAVRVNLPCSLLLIDQDLKAGAQLAAKLMEYGYTCRVVGEGLLDAALAQQRYDAAVLEISIEDARADRGLARLDRLAGFSGPIVLTSPAQLPVSAYGAPHRVRGSLLRPFFTESLAQAIEEARQSQLPNKLAPPAAFPSSPPPPPVAARAPSDPVLLAVPKSSGPSSSLVGLPLPSKATQPPVPAAAPKSEQHSEAAPASPPPELSKEAVEQLARFDTNVVRAVLVTKEGQNNRGRVRGMSIKGRILVETSDPYDSDRHVSVELCTSEGLRAELFGVVAGSTDTEMGIELEVPLGTQSIFRRFIEDALDITRPPLEAVRIKPQEAAVALEEKLIGDATLEARWLEVKDHLDDDPLQQRFIQECLRAQRLEFAVQCYRNLKSSQTDDPKAAKYLNQVGTILGFYAFKKDLAPERGMSLRLKVALGVFVCAVMILWVLVEMLS